MNNIRRLSIPNATNKTFLINAMFFDTTPYIKQQESIATNRYDTEYLVFAEKLTSLHNGNQRPKNIEKN